MKTFVALIALVGLMLLGCSHGGLPDTVSFAATCPESVPAPTYQVGDRFTWKYSNGKEMVWEVTGFEGDLAEVKWSDGDPRTDSDSAGTYFLGKDWVIKKGVDKQGNAVLSSATAAFSLIGIKVLSFPLRLGQTWQFGYQSRGYLAGALTTYSTIRKVVGCEVVATLAGRFLALKIEQTETEKTWGGDTVTYHWYSPDAKNIVKVEFSGSYGKYSGAGFYSHRPDYELIKLELR